MRWSEKPITWSQVDHPAVMPNPGSYALVLDPTFSSHGLTCRFSRVLVDGGSSINILYLDTLLKLGLKEKDLQLTSIVIHGMLADRQNRVGRPFRRQGSLPPRVHMV
ncbi:hypothetical protein ZWY2020_025620 [Hordeum vulgare]|nr:hypothetical protein ZWY2020_025620 [Hordeum vulgare]